MKSLTMLFLFYFFYVSCAFSYTMTVYTDQPDMKKANEVIETFKKTYPFNQFDITYDVKAVSAEELNCHPLMGIARNLGCDSQNIARDAASHGVDQAVIVKNVQDYGGSGGSIPVISATSPARMVLHEYLHTLGMADEYEYSVIEATFYCTGNSNANMVMIEPNPKGYASDEEARKQHMGQIPWNFTILFSTPITHGNQLGTGVVDSKIYAAQNSTDSPNKMGAPVGLYEGKRCNQMIPPKKSWQPGGEATIMEFLSAGLGAGNERMVAKILESRGVRRKDPPVEKTPLSVNDQHGNKEMVEPVHSNEATSTTSK